MEERLLKNSIKPFGKTGNEDQNSRTKVASAAIFNSNISRFSFKQLLKNADDYFLYLISYKAGYVMPKKGRPQTVIVIARNIK